MSRGDGLTKLVSDRNKRMNSARQLEVTARPTETKRICISCRRVPDALALKLAWNATYRYATPRRPWPGVGDTCPDCSGQLVEVTW